MPIFNVVEPAVPDQTFATSIVPVSRVNVLFVVAVTLDQFPLGIETVADGENDGAPKVYPGTIGKLGSLTVQEVPVGIPVTVCELPAETDLSPINPVPQS